MGPKQAQKKIEIGPIGVDLFIWVIFGFSNEDAEDIYLCWINSKSGHFWVFFSKSACTLCAFFSISGHFSEIFLCMRYTYF